MLNFLKSLGFTEKPVHSQDELDSIRLKASNYQAWLKTQSSKNPQIKKASVTAEQQVIEAIDPPDWDLAPMTPTRSPELTTQEVRSAAARCPWRTSK